MKSDLISRSELLENYGLKDAVKYGNKTREQAYHSVDTLMLYEIADMIESAPAVDAVPVVHAHWIDTGRSDDNDNYDFVCCRCKHTDIHSRQVKVPYCWFCGARMDEQEAQHYN